MNFEFSVAIYWFMVTVMYSFVFITSAIFLIGLLERPNVPPTIKILNFKLYMIGKGGVGKTSLVTYLSGAPDWTNSHHQGETPGIRTTNIYWPARIQNQLVLFQLDLWDSGETASKKYSHILPVSI